MTKAKQLLLILSHINFNCFQKTLSALKSSSMSNETLLNDKCMNMERKIQDLSHALTKMEEDKKRKELEFQESLKQERERLELVNNLSLHFM